MLHNREDSRAMKRFPAYYIPNTLTVMRLLAAPLLVYLFLENQVWWACLVFTLAALTDLFDGLLARLLNAESDVGALLDPFADKTLVIVGYITLSAWGMIPGELVVLVACRDLAIVTIYFSFPTASTGGRVEASRLSKFNTACQAILLFVAFWALGLPQLGFDYDFSPFLNILIVLVAVTTLSSGLGYLWNWLKRLKRS